MPLSETIQRWYPTTQQLKDPSSLERSFRQLLDQHYALQDAHDELLAKVNAPTDKLKGPPPGSGPTDTQICGLYVAPIDTRTLADGAALKFSKKNGNLAFS